MTGRRSELPREAITGGTTMGQVTVITYDREDPDDAARWVACENCGQLEHPELSCDQAIELVRSAALRELLRTHGPVLLAALQEAADERVERVGNACVDCARSHEGRCMDHQTDLERAAEYRRTHDVLSALVKV
jgi:hypothetical protein